MRRLSYNTINSESKGSGDFYGLKFIILLLAFSIKACLKKKLKERRI